ncbi:glycosyl hydrolase family 65 protein [Paenibacillus chibensis]|uniref:Glycosyl hydrolase family 65 protein n=1 Tax=Paenibacillus chibensis TaxID=59846 RepID=A0ABU6PYY8_9BACL|nr:glycosyl hydrolase family 65 protein [Paenibacillus chibensis]
MAKIADKYLKVDPWSVVEEGFNPERNRVSESIFALGNEYMGVRGYPEEGYGGDTLLGSYFNGLYEEMPVQGHYRGTIRSLRFMVNAVDWLYTRITVDGEQLDLAQSRFSGFRRVLDFRKGTVRRELVWHAKDGKELAVCFERLVSMTRSHVGAQRITITPLNFSGTVQIRSGLDFNTLHEDQGRRFWSVVHREQAGNGAAMLGRTANTGNRLFASFTLHTQGAEVVRSEPVEQEHLAGTELTLQVVQGQAAVVDKVAVNAAFVTCEKPDDAVWDEGQALLGQTAGVSYDELSREQAAYWEEIWRTSDIRIEGDPENQQGIRFCIFQMYQTYHGDNPGFNIGAKGLTGEAYRGLAFWDTETYCLPFYLFNNPKAAKSLLEFRYRSLEHAKQRAREVDCEGAFYPIATIDGTESCDLWQHSNLQLHVGTAVAYGLWHYDRIVSDKAFLYEKGIEMLIEISRFYATRGQWGQKSGQYGYFGVMGPDEFQLMVNNNCYINLMAKKLFEYTKSVLAEMETGAPAALKAVSAKTGLRAEELENWTRLAEHMKIPYDEETGIYEEHDGFFDMPHIDIHSIPVTEFPLYSHWSYDRLYRYDMIKQPDVLMFMFLYNSEYSAEAKRANYEYYEPRCIHESSLSPSIHSILAAEIGRHEEAYHFFEFATRLDLDNYNRNTREGLHTTSIAAAWMNIVYGFGGLRSDGEGLALAPSIPQAWDEYSFNMTYRGSVLEIKADQQRVSVRVTEGDSVVLRIYGEDADIGIAGVEVPMPQSAVKAGS